MLSEDRNLTIQGNAYAYNQDQRSAVLTEDRNRLIVRARGRRGEGQRSAAVL